MNDLNKEYYVLYPDNNQNYPMIGASLTPDYMTRPVNENSYELLIYNVSDQ